MKHLLPILLLATIATCCAPRRASVDDSHHPVIGISCSRYSTGLTYLSTAYSDAVVKAGGVALVIPTVGSQAEADAVLEVLDAIVLSGGEDISPAWYGEEVLNATVSIDPVRDYSDSLLASGALSRGMPVLAICRGEQLVNVLLGGSLYQDLPTQVGSDVAHRGAMHPIVLERESILYELFGKDTLIVNSSHHQAVKTPAPGIHITAHSLDGVVEAYEADNVVAVQFHPEVMVKDGEDAFLALFSNLVQRCR